MTLQVRCRTPDELTEGISAEESREREQQFFMGHPELKHLGEEFKGIPALSRKLVQIQDQCIQSHLPTLQKEVIAVRQCTCSLCFTSVPYVIVCSSDMSCVMQT